jgi:hypothetical protein
MIARDSMGYRIESLGISMRSGWDIPRDLGRDQGAKSFACRDTAKKGYLNSLEELTA